MANITATTTFKTPGGTATLEVGPKQKGTGYSATLTAPGQPPITFFVNTLEQLHTKLAAHGLGVEKLPTTALPGPSLQPSVSVAGKKPAETKQKEASQQQIFLACDVLGIKVPAKLTPEFKTELKEKVIAYQKQLYDEGYDVGAKGFDGIMGPDTAEAAAAKKKNDGAQPTDGFYTNDAGIEKQFQPYKSAVETADKGGDLQAKIDARESTAKHLHGLDAALAKKISLTKDPKEKAHLEAKQKEIKQTLATPPMSDLPALKAEQSFASAKPSTWSDANGPKPKVFEDYEHARAALMTQHAAAKTPGEKAAIAKKVTDLDAAAHMYQATSQSAGKDTTEKALKAKIAEAKTAKSPKEYAKDCVSGANFCMAKAEEAAKAGDKKAAAKWYAQATNVFNELQKMKKDHPEFKDDHDKLMTRWKSGPALPGETVPQPKAW